MSTEKEREAHVYTAKLAEQAERYEGLSLSLIPKRIRSLLTVDFLSYVYTYKSVCVDNFPMLSECQHVAMVP